VEEEVVAARGRWLLLLLLLVHGLADLLHSFIQRLSSAFN